MIIIKITITIVRNTKNNDTNRNFSYKCNLKLPKNVKINIKLSNYKIK